MSTLVDFVDVAPQAAETAPTAAQISFGIPVPPVRLLQVMSPADWEGFTEEWLSFHKSNGLYAAIRRYSGPGDLGLDVVGFTSEQWFDAPWDSYQCKHYDHALEPGDVFPEVGKIIYHSFVRTPPFNQSRRTPRTHVFVPPRGVGITVGRLLKDPARFKQEMRGKWDSHVVPKLGKNVVAPLDGELRQYFDAFDFSIFGDRSGVELLDEHAKTIFYAPRFGGGLPPREESGQPPAQAQPSESVYLRRLFDAYGDHLGKTVNVLEDLDANGGLRKHYDRQRVLFYCAESLRNFARDRTPAKTFDTLQDDIFHSVIDICDANHADGLERLRATITAAGQADVGGNALVTVTRIADKQGICHQLANDDRLAWVQDDA